MLRDSDIFSKPQWMSSLAPGPGEGTSSGETPQGPRKKRARVDPTVESVCVVNSLDQTVDTHLSNFYH